MACGFFYLQVLGHSKILFVNQPEEGVKIDGFEVDG